MVGLDMALQGVHYARGMSLVGYAAVPEKLCYWGKDREESDDEKAGELMN